MDHLEHRAVVTVVYGVFYRLGQRAHFAAVAVAAVAGGATATAAATAAITTALITVLRLSVAAAAVRGMGIVTAITVAGIAAVVPYSAVRCSLLLVRC